MQCIIESASPNLQIRSRVEGKKTPSDILYETFFIDTRYFSNGFINNLKKYYDRAVYDNNDQRLLTDRVYATKYNYYQFCLMEKISDRCYVGVGNTGQMSIVRNIGDNFMWHTRKTVNLYPISNPNVRPDLSKEKNKIMLARIDEDTIKKEYYYADKLPLKKVYEFYISLNEQGKRIVKCKESIKFSEKEGDYVSRVISSYNVDEKKLEKLIENLPQIEEESAN